MSASGYEYGLAMGRKLASVADIEREWDSANDAAKRLSTDDHAAWERMVDVCDGLSSALIERLDQQAMRRAA